MSFSNSDKVIIISKNNRAIAPIKHALNRHNLTIADRYPNLNSISIIKSGILRTKNTTFIRTELLRFIKESGFPPLIIIDYKIDTGLGDSFDPDQMKILRTILISFIILKKGKGFENLRANLILLVNGKELPEVQKYKSSIKILDILTTKDSKVNNFIDEFRNDPGKFTETFTLRWLNTETPTNQITSFVDNFLIELSRTNNVSKINVPPDPGRPKADSGNYTPASIIFEDEDGIIYSDMKVLTDVSQELMDIDKNRIYIHGYWTNKTLKEVGEKLVKFVKHGIKDKFRFSQDDEIDIILGDFANIDSTTIASLTRSILNDLNNYPNIKLFLNEENEAILRKSDGFNLIKKQTKIIGT